LIESFNGKFRAECMNQNWFVHLRHAREVIESWRVDYNTVRPHSSLRYRTREAQALRHQPPSSTVGKTSAHPLNPRVEHPPPSLKEVLIPVDLDG
jgi:putative transposase